MIFSSKQQYKDVQNQLRSVNMTINILRGRGLYSQAKELEDEILQAGFKKREVSEEEFKKGIKGGQFSLKKQDLLNSTLDIGTLKRMTKKTYRNIIDKKKEELKEAEGENYEEYSDTEIIDVLHGEEGLDDFIKNYKEIMYQIEYAIENESKQIEDVNEFLRQVKGLDEYKNLSDKEFKETVQKEISEALDVLGTSLVGKATTKSGLLISKLKMDIIKKNYDDFLDIVVPIKDFKRHGKNFKGSV